jgi:hypothetical protein
VSGYLVLHAAVIVTTAIVIGVAWLFARSELRRRIR